MVALYLVSSRCPFRALYGEGGFSIPFIPLLPFPAMLDCFLNVCYGRNDQRNAGVYLWTRIRKRYRLVFTLSERQRLHPLRRCVLALALPLFSVLRFVCVLWWSIYTDSPWCSDQELGVIGGTGLFAAFCEFRFGRTKCEQYLQGKVPNPKWAFAMLLCYCNRM